MTQPLGPNQEKFLAALESGGRWTLEETVAADFLDDGFMRLMDLLIRKLPPTEIAAIIHSDPAMYFREAR